MTSVITLVIIMNNIRELSRKIKFKVSHQSLTLNLKNLFTNSIVCKDSNSKHWMITFLAMTSILVEMSNSVKEAGRVNNSAKT